MAVQITGRYLGDKKVQVTHGPSGTELVTVPPVDNQGDGSSFSPTDLVPTSLGACMLTVMGIVAERSGISLEGTEFSVEKHMQKDPRRIGRLPVTIHLPQALTPEERSKLERTALTCPVHKSLHPEIEIPVEFIYDR